MTRSRPQEGEVHPLLGGKDNDEAAPLLGCKAADEEPPALCIKQNELYGYVLMVLSTACYSVMWLVTRLVTGYRAFSVASVVFLRGAVQLMLALSSLTVLDRRAVFALPRGLLGPLIARGVLGAVACALYLHGIARVPLGVATTLFFTNPLFVVLLSAASLGERLGPSECIAGAVSLLGVVMVTDPWHAAALPGASRHTYTVGVLLSLLAAATAAATYVTLRSIAPRIHYMLGVISVGASLAVTGVAMGGASPRALLASPKDTALTAAGCIAAFAGQCLLSAAYQHARAGTGALVRNLDLPFVFVLSAAFLGEVPRFSSVLGATLVVGATLALAFIALRTRQERTSSLPTSSSSTKPVR